MFSIFNGLNRGTYNMIKIVPTASDGKKISLWIFVRINTFTHVKKYKQYLLLYMEMKCVLWFIL